MKKKNNPMHPHEDKVTHNLISDDTSAYANVPKGSHYREFEVPEDYGVSIRFARDKYEGNQNIRPVGKRHSY